MLRVPMAIGEEHSSHLSRTYLSVCITNEEKEERKRKESQERLEMKISKNLSLFNFSLSPFPSVPLCLSSSFICHKKKPSIFNVRILGIEVKKNRAKRLADELKLA
jgi:hypothetical protein